MPFVAITAAPFSFGLILSDLRFFLLRLHKPLFRNVCEPPTTFGLCTTHSIWPMMAHRAPHKESPTTFHLLELLPLLRLGVVTYYISLTKTIEVCPGYPTSPTYVPEHCVTGQTLSPPGRHGRVSVNLSKLEFLSQSLYNADGKLRILFFHRVYDVLTLRTFHGISLHSRSV